MHLRSHPAPHCHHILHHLVVHPLRRRLLLPNLHPSRHQCLRPGVCDVDQLHLRRRRVHVVVAGCLSSRPRRVVHEENATGSTYLLCLQENQRCNFTRPELTGVQGGGDHPAPKDRRVGAGIYHVDADAARRRRRRRRGAHLSVRADEQPLPRRHLPHEPRRRDRAGPLRPRGHR